MARHAVTQMQKPTEHLAGHATFIRSAARAGHLATGTVYVIVGALALVAAFDVQVKAMGSQGALHRVLGTTLGPIALLAIAAGLTADAAWQVVRAAVNADRAASNVKGYADRMGWLISGAIHLGLGVAAVKLALGIRQKTAEVEVKSWVASAMSVPFGRWLVAAVGVGVIVVGLAMSYRALIGDVDRWLDLSPMARTSRRLIMALGSFGLAARAVIFCVGGSFLILAAVHYRPSEAVGLGGVFRAIQYASFGTPVLATVALGFIANGFLELIRARFRRIEIR